MVQGWRGEERRREGRIEERRGEEQEKGAMYQSKKRGGDARSEERTRGNIWRIERRGEERGGEHSREYVRRGEGRGA